MTNYELISVALSGLSTVFSLIAIVVAIRSHSKATSIGLANNELYMNERITNTKERVSDISMQLEPLISKEKRTPREEKQLEVFIKNFRAAIENNLNTYEEACAQYLEKKVDKKSFERHYRIEIRNLVEDKATQEYFDAVTSKYRAILKVYELWEGSKR